MLEANVTIIEELKKFVTTVSSRPDFLQYFKKSDCFFTRERKLPFSQLVLFIAKLCKKTLSLELEDFFEEINSDTPCTLSAFVQQRAKLSDSFFHCWNAVLLFNFYLHYGTNVKRWKGYRIMAGDGSSIGLTNNEALARFFGGQANQRTGYVLGKIYYCYDVLNELILFPRLSAYRYGEIQMAYESIEYLESDMLMIYDRNFASYKTIALHLLFITKDSELILRRLNELFVRDIVPIRKGRYYPRRVKNKKTKGKYTTFSNFKPSF